MARILVPGRKPLVLPGTDKRILRRPDASGLIVPELSGAPLSSSEVDYDDLTIVRQWREYASDAPDEVRYFCYELRQHLPGAAEPDHFFKAVRLIRLTRVPRYLQQRPTNEAFRDLLAGLREKHVLFVNLIAKSPQMPLVFAYGVQGVGQTLREAVAAADEAHAALTFALDGTYQQLEYKPLSVAEGELLSRYQAEWRNIAMARGRPMPEAGGIGASGVLDGNRTDAQQTNDAISAFVRGMGDKSFMLSMVTVPLTPEDMSHAWRNIAMKLSAVRSDQQGSRTVGASFSLPLGLGTSLSSGHGTTHGLTGSESLGSSDGLSSSYTEGVSVSHSDGVSASTSHGTSASHSEGTSASVNHGVSESHSASASDSQSASVTDTSGTSTSVGESLSHSQSVSASQGTSDSVSLGHSLTQSNTQSLSESAGTSQGASLSQSNSAATNWSNSVGQSLSAGQTVTDNWSKNFGESLSQTFGLSAGHSTGQNQGSSHQNSANMGSGIPGMDLGLGETLGTSRGDNIGNTNGQSASQTGGGSTGVGVGSSLGSSMTAGQNIGESQGGSLGQSVTGTNSVGSTHSLTAGQSLGVSQGTSATQTAGVSSSVGQSSGLTAGTSLSHGASDARATGVSSGQSLSTGVTTGSSAGTSQGVSASDSVGVSRTDTSGISRTDTSGASASATDGASTALSRSQAVSDAWMVAMSRQAAQSGSLGVVPGLSASISKATFDEAKRSLGDILEAQMKRYHDGIEGGAMLYQMFLVTQDRETLVGAATLLKAAFWGPGGTDKGRLVQPFHTIVIDDEDEADRLLTHAAALTHYRKREQVVELIEPHHYSSYVTTGEAAVLSSPPLSESVGLMAQVDSMPLFAMPADRANRDLYVGHIVNGERGRVSEQRFGIDLNEITHMLIQGTTGSGKTSTMNRILEQAVALEKDVVTVPTAANPTVQVLKRKAGVLAFDWMENMRNLATMVSPDRFQLFSIAKPELGAFRWNPLEIPHPHMDPRQWLGAQADQLASSFGLGEMGRSLIADYIDQLYTANRLEPFTLREEKVDEDGSLLRRGMWLPAVAREDLPAGAIQPDGFGGEVANVYTCTALSRLVSLEHVAALVVSLVEELATPEGARQHGTSMRDRAQSLWRRIQPYAPGGQLSAMVAADPDLRTRECLGVADIIDPDRGLVTVIETDGLDMGHRRVILGSVMLAVYRYGLHVGKGAFDNGGRGPGTFLVLEESHELFGAVDEGEDSAGAKMRAHLYESMFRRARATGLRLVAMTQNCAQIPSAITSQTTTVIAHRSYDQADRSRLADLFSWDRGPVGQVREIRYLGEMPVGYALVRLDARTSYLESAPVQVLVDPPAIAAPSEEFLRQLAATRAQRLGRGSLV